MNRKIWINIHILRFYRQISFSYRIPNIWNFWLSFYNLSIYNPIRYKIRIPLMNQSLQNIFNKYIYFYYHLIFIISYVENHNTKYTNRNLVQNMFCMMDDKLNIIYLSYHKKLSQLYEYFMIYIINNFHNFEVRINYIIHLSIFDNYNFFLYF
jgi:hypothetical protein